MKNVVTFPLPGVSMYIQTIKIMSSKNVQIATEIIHQIGNRALHMIGAKQVVAVENGVRFKIGRNCKAVNMIKITLNGSDLYDVEYMSVRGMSVKIKSEAANLYFDQLHDSIESNTGMYTSL